MIVLIAALLRGLIIRRDLSDGRLAVRDGIAAAIIVLLIAFQATTGTLMEYPWLFAGTALGLVFASRRPLAE